jgi:hypothetical protein
MYAMTEIELSGLHREDVARQVENNRLSRQLWANRRGMATAMRNALPGRFFASNPRKGQTVEC